jgi:hypothetical protein
MGGLGAAIDEAARMGGAPLGRDHLPELELLPAENQGLFRRLTGVSVLADEETADTETHDDDPSAAGTPTPASLLTGETRAALRLLAPLLLTGSGSGFQARLPYEIDLR